MSSILHGYLSQLSTHILRHLYVAVFGFKHSFNFLIRRQEKGHIVLPLAWPAYSMQLWSVSEI